MRGAGGAIDEAGAHGGAAKSAIVADLNGAGAPISEAARARARRARLRAAGLCTVCGVNPAPGRSRCGQCAATQAAARAARAARARMGAALEPRLQAAARAGRGARLTAAEVRAALAAGPARRGQRAP